MQIAIVVPQSEWEALLSRLEKLEQQTSHKADTVKADDKILTVREAAARLQLTPDAIRRARLVGIRRNEKEWGFYTSVVDSYHRRYERPRLHLHAAAA